MKAYHAQQQYAGVKVPVAAPDDEITIFGGRAEAVVRSPPSTPSSPPRANPPPEAPAPPSRRDTIRPPPAPAPAPPVVPPMTIPAPPLAQFDVGDYAADPRFLQQSWEGLYREAAPAYGLQHEYSMDTAMDDRWSSFMHNLEDERPVGYA